MASLAQLSTYGQFFVVFVTSHVQLAFLFTNGFLMDAVRFRMQAVHRQSLQKSIQTWIENHQADLKKIFLRKMLDDKVFNHRVS